MRLNKRKKSLLRDIIFGVVVLLAFVGILMITASKGPDFGGTAALVGLICLLLALFLLVVYYIWFSKKNRELERKWKYLTTAAAAWFAFRIPFLFQREFVIGDLIVLWGLAIFCIVRCRFGTKRIEEIFCYEFLFSFLFVSKNILLLHPVDQWLQDKTFVTGLIAVPVFVALTVAYHFHFAKYNPNLKKVGSIAVNVMFAILLGFVFGFFSAQSLNYALDTSTPTEYEYQITDKTISSGHRRRGRSGSKSYYLWLETGEGEMKFSVTKGDYENYEIGDVYTVALYDGAFDEPYYISGNRD